MHPLVKVIKQTTGLSMGEFCEKELKTDYKAFYWRLTQERLRPDEIFYMIWRTRKSVQDLFNKSWHEMVINNSNGPVVERVQDIISKMTKDETKEIERLLGFQQYREKREHERHAAEPIPNAKYPLTQKDVTPKPLVPFVSEAPATEIPEPETPKPTLLSIFKNTY